MNPVADLANYLHRVDRRFRLLAWVKSTATVTATTLALTITLSAILTYLSFSPATLALCRRLLALGVVTAVIFSLVTPLLRLNSRLVALRAERKHHAFEQRLFTFNERQNRHPSDPFLPFLAADTLEVATGTTPDTFVKKSLLSALAMTSVIAAAVLVWLILAGPGRIGHDSQVLWAMKSVFSIEVQPSRRIISCGSEVSVVAHMEGFAAKKADLRVRLARSPKWERIPMQAQDKQDESETFEYKFAALTEDAEFYVESEGLRSLLSNIRAVDLPRVKNIRSTYSDQPQAGLGSDAQDETNGDLVAPFGAAVGLDIETDRPMNSGELIFSHGDPLKLPDTQNNKTATRLTITENRSYHVAVMYRGELVQVSKEHVISAIKETRYRKGQPNGLPEGNRYEPSRRVPAGYEKAVAEYFRRLNDLKLVPAKKRTN